MKRATIGLAVGLWLAGLAARGAVAPLELKDGDRIVLVGSTLIEREAESGYLETRIARRYPGRAITVRNLGWSGDTVAGASRGKPNPRVDGFRDLVDHVAALKPTVIVLGYGAVESFDGAGGLPAFAAGVDRLWAELSQTGARVVVLTPPRQEKLGPPLPDPTAHNLDIARYADLLKTEAARRGAPCVDLFAAMAGDDPTNVVPWTTNGLHLAPAGYWMASALIAPAMSGPTAPGPVAPFVAVSVVIADGKATATAAGAAVADLLATPSGVKCRVTVDLLPEPPRPAATEPPTPLASRLRLLRVAGLAPGRYQLRVDGTPIAATGDAERWRQGIDVHLDAEIEQVEELRRHVVRKNLLYFHRWRPQNETYLFGFRKHEQGRNAAELAAFDPLVAAEEAEIVRLSRPVPRTYELVRLPEGEVAR